MALSAPRPARADDPAAVEAQARFKEGVELANRSKFEEARVKFLQAAAVLKVPAVLYNLASAEETTSRHLDALQHYRAFLVMARSDARITDAMRDKAREGITRSLKLVGQLRLSAPEGAQVTVDGQVAEPTGEPVAVAPGRHAVEGTFHGEVRTVAVEATAGAVTSVRLEFAPSPPKPAAAPSATPSLDPAAPPKAHRTTAGYVVPAVTGVLGLAGIATGVAFWLSWVGYLEDGKRMVYPGICTVSSSPDCVAFTDKRASANSAQVGLAVGFTAGGVFLAGSIATFLLWPKEEPARAATSARLRVLPQLDARGVGAVLDLRY
jgi:hypothetical protein